jgi:outer membrane receptor protein involved in Fe transport
MLLAFTGTSAQVTSAPPMDAATLAKYDRNQNGRLDADEQATLEADRRRVAASLDSAATADETVTLSPFEVSSDSRGYYAANTLAGTRFNSKLEDLASSLTVLTKEQMADFAMLDINDVFLYAANTEGTGDYTAFSVDSDGNVSDTVSTNPNNANRVRGMSSASISLGNYKMSGITPVDPLNVEGIEISRGPNANLFGIGGAGGALNMVPATASLRRDRTETVARADSYDGYRFSFDANRVLVRHKLAVRINGAFQHDGFVRKPSGVDHERYNGMIRYQPTRQTTLTASFGYYSMHGTRPNMVPPRDDISYWLESGKPTWNPITRSITTPAGQVLGPYTSIAALDTMPDYFNANFAGNLRSQLFIDQGGLQLWTNTRLSSTNPYTGGTTYRYVAASPAAGTRENKFVNQPLFSSVRSMANRNLYDWTSINLNAVNWQMTRTLTGNAELEQVFLHTPRQTLVAKAGYLREEAKRYNRLLFGGGKNGSTGQSGLLCIDPNTRLLDNTPNPFFGRPYVAADMPTTQSLPQLSETARLQLAYRLDLTKEKNALRWLGAHQFTAYDEAAHSISRRYTFRDGMSSKHEWLTGSRVNQTTDRSIDTSRCYFRFYVGDSNGGNVDYAPTNFRYGNYPFFWGRGPSGPYFPEPATLALLPTADSTGGGNNSNSYLHTTGAVVQSFFLGGRVVTTFGARRDTTYIKQGATGFPILILPDYYRHDVAKLEQWAVGDYDKNQGDTKTAGLVARPFRHLGMIRRAQESGGIAARLATVLDGLSLTFNRSNSFSPSGPAEDLMSRRLGNETSEGKDYGFWLNFGDGQFMLRGNWYKVKQPDRRNGTASTIAQRTTRLDIYGQETLQLQDQATAWVSEKNPTWSQAQVATEVARQMGLSPERLAYMETQFPPLAATEDSLAKGKEFEIYYNPRPFWTMSASATETEAITTRVSSSIAEWIAVRMPVWTTIVDPRTNTRWWTTQYGSNTPANYFATDVMSPYSLLLQQQGKSNPQIRRYRAKFTTRFRLEGITDNRLLRRFNIGGSLRWEDKGAIGYYGLQQLPAIITDLDPRRPIYDKGHYYVDAFIGYRTKLFGGKVGANFQLNVRNLQEDGRLQPVGAYPDGTPSTYRIVDPRQFILQTTFSL